MIDPLTVGSYCVVLFAVAPIILLFAYQTGIHPQEKVNSDSSLKSLVQASPAQLTLSPKYQSVKSGASQNPEMVLAQAYNDQALSEISRCAPSGFNGTMCEDTIALLVKSCANSDTRVSACDDPRLLLFKAST